LKYVDAALAPVTRALKPPEPPGAPISSGRGEASAAAGARVAIAAAVMARRRRAITCR
jgi:hypothetical protein